MTYVYYWYFLISVISVLISDIFLPILKEPYSWWLLPLLILGVFVCLVLLQLIVLVITILTTNTNKDASPKKTAFFRLLVKISLPLLIKCAKVQIRTTGAEKVPLDTRFLLVCNHQHDLDPAIILSPFLDREIGFIGKKEIYTEMRFIAKAMHLLGSFPIDRENDREAAKTIIKAVKTIKDDISSIVIFPEGYTNLKPEENILLPFRNGAFKIATKASVPIVVCVLNNTRQIPKNILRRKTVVDFKVLSVIYPDEYKDMNTAQIGEIIYTQMEEELKKLRS